MASKTPRQISHFELHDLLGQGGMGEVYLALDTRLQRPVALKVMHGHIARRETFRERFVQEARAIAALTHPHIISVYSFDADKDGLYLVMEYFPNGSLRNYLRDRYEQGKLLDLSEVLLLLSQVAAALDYAHQQNMIHRDVKPDNVLLKSTPNIKTGDIEVSAVLTDFGLVKLAESSEFQTQGDNPLGTLPYMAPEQIQGMPIDKRADTYSLGIMFYELVAGRLPFRPQNLWEAGDMHIKQAPPRPSEFRPGISDKFEAIILKSIAKDPNNRYQSGREFIAALQELEGEEADFKTSLDSTALADGRLDSLGTYLSSRPHISLERLFPSEVGEAIEQDRLVVQPPEGDIIYIDIPSDSFTIGRSDAADVTLDDRKISKIHARISRDAGGNYVIQDLASTNGTHLEGTKLLSQVEQAWQEGQTVRLGTHQLRFQKATQPAFGTFGDVGAVQSLREKVFPIGGEVGKTVFTMSAGVNVGIAFSPSTITLDAGQRQNLNVEITNNSGLVEHFTLVIEGIASEWVTLPANPLQLLPGSSGVMTVNFHPPKSWKSTAGRHEFTIKALSEEREQEIGFSKGYLIINPFYEFRTDLDPQLVRQQGKIRFAIHNRGNSPLSFEVSARDREAALVIDPSGKSVTLEPGAGDVSEFRIELGPDIQIETERTFPIEFRAVPDHGEEQVQRGELVATAAIPTGTLPYTVFDPQGGQHTLNLPTDMLAAELLTYILGQLGLPPGDYHLANGKTGVQLPIGQTLAEAGIGMGGVVWVQGEAAPSPTVSQGPVLSLRPKSLDYGALANQFIRELELTIRNSGERELRGHVVALVDWLEVVGSDVVRVGPEEMVYFVLRTRYDPTSAISRTPVVDVRTNAKNTRDGSYIVYGSYTAAWVQPSTLPTGTPYPSGYGSAGPYVPPSSPTYPTQSPVDVPGWVSALSMISGLAVAIASLLLIYGFFGLNWLGDNEVGITPYEIWTGKTEGVEFTLDIEKGTKGEVGFGAVRGVDRLLIVMPLGGGMLLLLLGFYMANPSKRRQIAMWMAVVAAIMLILPFAWEQLSTQNWRGGLESQSEALGVDTSSDAFKNGLDLTLDASASAYNTDQYIAFGAFALAVSILLYGASYVRFTPVSQGRGQLVLTGAATAFAALLILGVVLLLSENEADSTAALGVAGLATGIDDSRGANANETIPTATFVISPTPTQFGFVATEVILPTTTSTFTPRPPGINVTEEVEPEVEAVATEEAIEAFATMEVTEEVISSGRDGWAVFSGRGMQIELPDYWYAMNLSGDLDTVLDQAERLYPQMSAQLQIIRQNPDLFRMLALDPNLSAVGFATNIVVVMEPLPSGMSRDDYLDATLASLPSQFDVEYVRDLTIDSQLTALLEINQVVSGLNVRQQVYIIQEGNRMWILTYSADRDTFRALESMFEYSASTFRVQN